MKNRAWTKEEEDFLRINQHLTIWEMIDNLPRKYNEKARTYGSVAGRLVKLNLTHAKAPHYGKPKYR